MTNLNKTKWIKGKGHKSLFYQTQKTTLVRLIRYVDNFVIIINDERLVEQYFEEAKSFLAEHWPPIIIRKNPHFSMEDWREISFY